MIPWELNEHIFCASVIFQGTASVAFDTFLKMTVPHSQKAKFHCPKSCHFMHQVSVAK